MPPDHIVRVSHTLIFVFQLWVIILKLDFQSSKNSPFKKVSIRQINGCKLEVSSWVLTSPDSQQLQERADLRGRWQSLSVNSFICSLKGEQLLLWGYDLEMISYVENCKWLSETLLWALACFLSFQHAVSFFQWNVGYLHWLSYLHLVFVGL